MKYRYKCVAWSGNDIFLRSAPTTPIKLISNLKFSIICSVSEPRKPFWDRLNSPPIKKKFHIFRGLEDFRNVHHTAYNGDFQPRLYDFPCQFNIRCGRIQKYHIPVFDQSDCLFLQFFVSALHFYAFCWPPDCCVPDAGCPAAPLLHMFS